MPKQYYNNPIDYLQNVLDTWIAFCKHHPDFEHAIMYVLLENRRLKNKITQLEEQLNGRRH